MPHSSWPPLPSCADLATANAEEGKGNCAQPSRLARGCLPPQLTHIIHWCYWHPCAVEKFLGQPHQSSMFEWLQGTCTCTPLYNVHVYVLATHACVWTIWKFRNCNFGKVNCCTWKFLWKCFYHARIPATCIWYHFCFISAIRVSCKVGSKPCLYVKCDVVDYFHIIVYCLPPYYWKCIPNPTAAMPEGKKCHDGVPQQARKD